MSLIMWDDSFSVNIMEIDIQHKKLLALVNELHDAMKERKGQDVLSKILKGLIRYTETHFKTEEIYFDRFGYPGATEHINEHAEFNRKINEFKAGLENGKLGLSIDVMHFLSNWLKNHIKITDMKYAGYFNEKGLK